MKKYTASVLIAGCLWGFMGLFRRYLGDAGISASGIVLLRCGIGAVLFAITLALTDRRGFKIKLRDLWCFVGSGIVSLLFFTFCYFQAMSLMSLSEAAILLYTAPAIVTVLSAVIFKEKLTGVKIAAVVVAFIGCAFVCGLGGGGLSFTPMGLIFGLCTGLGYALYSIFARLALDRGYRPNTVNFYSCAFAAIGAGLIWGVKEPVSIMFSSPSNALLCLAAGALTCYLPYMLYTYGLTGLEAGKASVMASVEPVVATLVGVFIFKEQLSALSAVGVTLVLAAVVLLNLHFSKQKTV